MKEVAERDRQERQVDDGGAGDGIPRGEVHPDDAGDDEPREDGLEEQLRGRRHDALFGDVDRRAHRRRIEDAAVREDDRARAPAEEVPREDDQPVAEERRDRRQPFERERHWREGVFGVELVAADDDVDELEGVQERRDHPAFGPGRHRRVEEERDRDREAGGQAAEEELAGARGDLVVRVGDDPLEDLVRGEPMGTTSPLEGTLFVDRASSVESEPESHITDPTRRNGEKKPRSATWAPPPDRRSSSRRIGPLGVVRPFQTAGSLLSFGP